MTDFIPGDSYRIDVVGADSSIIIDSWLSQIKANVVNRDGLIQVDTTFGKLYGPMIGNIENDEGDVLFNTEAGTVHMDLIGDVKDDNNNIIVDSARSLVKGNLEGNIVNNVGDVIYDTNTNTLVVDRVLGDFYGTLYGGVDLIGSISGSFIGDLDGTTTGMHNGDVLGNVIGNLNGNIVNEDDEVIFNNSSRTFYGELSGGIVTPDGVPVLNWNETFEHYNIAAGIEHPDTQKTILELNNNDQECVFKGSIRYFDGSEVLKLVPWTGTDKPELLAEFTGRHIGEVSDPNREPMLKYFEGTQLLGTNNGNINIGREGTETVKIFADNVDLCLQSNPVNTSNLGQLNFFSFNGDAEHKLPLNPGDHMMVATTHAWDGTAYKIGGGFGFYANTETTPDPELEIYPTDFAISLSDGVNLPSAFWDNPTGLNFDGKGVLSVPIIKSKGRTSAEITDITPEEGMIIFNSSTKKFQGYNGTSWVNLG